DTWYESVQHGNILGASQMDNDVAVEDRWTWFAGRQHVYAVAKLCQSAPQIPGVGSDTTFPGNAGITGRIKPEIHRGVFARIFQRDTLELAISVMRSSVSGGSGWATCSMGSCCPHAMSQRKASPWKSAYPTK